MNIIKIIMIIVMKKLKLMLLLTLDFNQLLLIDQVILSELQQEQRLRRPQPRQNINTSMDKVI